MSKPFERTLAAAYRFPARPTYAETHPRLNVAVIFTSVHQTVAALKRAGVLAGQLNGRITLMVPQVVPYALPLGSPPVSVEWTERRFRVIANESLVETAIQIYLCRDPFDALKAALSPCSLVVIGDTRRWWPTRERRLAKRPRHSGHEVILVEGA